MPSDNRDPHLRQKAVVELCPLPPSLSTSPDSMLTIPDPPQDRPLNLSCSRQELQNEHIETGIGIQTTQALDPHTTLPFHWQKLPRQKLFAMLKQGMADNSLLFQHLMNDEDPVLGN